MAFKDGAGTLDVTPYAMAGVGFVDALQAVPVAPLHRDVMGIPYLTFMVDNTSSVDSDVQVEVSTSLVFSSTVFTQTLTSLADGHYTIAVTGLVSGTKYYWRVRASEEGTGDWGAWSTTPFLQEGSYSYPARSNATASSVESAVITPASRAIDGDNYDTSWMSATFASMPQWHAHQIPSTSPDRVLIKPHSSNLSRTPRDFVIEGSNDGIDWTVIETFTDAELADWQYPDAPREFVLPITGPWTHIRLYCTETNGSSAIQLTDIRTAVYTPGPPGPWEFTYSTGWSAAGEVITLNVGAIGIPDPRAGEYVHLNAGFVDELHATADEQIHLNVGFEVWLNQNMHKYIYLDANEDVPIPHIWFLWRPFGFAGNEVWAYGHGFGNPQAEYDGSMMINPGPNYSTADETAGVNEWYEVIAGEDAYTEDRRIWPGGWDDEPIVDTEVGVIRFVIPAIVMPDLDPVTHRMYVTHDGGMSNEMPWIMYPTIPVAVGSVHHGVGTRTVMRLSADFGGSGIAQRWFYTDQPEYVITDGLPQRPPMFTSRATTVAQLGMWSTEDSLSSALSVDLGADHRWVADAGELTPRPDLGTGVTVWDPSVGATTKGWRLDSETAPYIDPAYTIPSRLGDLAIPAMIFPGDAFAELTANVPTGPVFTIAIVAVLHAPPSGRGTLFSTFRDLVDPDTHDHEVYVENGKIRVTIGGRYTHRFLFSTEGRPVIIISTVNVADAQLVIIDEAPSSHVSGGLQMAPDGNGAYLGRSWRIDDRIDTANMDVLEVAWWDAPLSSADAWSAASKLDGIYGVTG